MSTQKKNKKILPPRWTTFIFCSGAKLIMHLKYKIRIDRSVLRRQKRGCIIIYNHFSNRDHLLITAASNYRRFTFVLTSYFFFNKKLAPLLRLHRTIKKDQFRPDIGAIRQIKKVIENNGKVVIAPAGQVSLTGESPYINPAIVKLIKTCNCDVIALQIRGAHLSFPKWRKRDRKCRIDLKFVDVLKQEQLKELSDQEIHKLLVDSIDVDEYNDQLKMMRPIKGKNLTDGLDDVLLVCPKCHRFYTNYSLHSHIICSHCQNTVVMDKYGFISPKSENDQFFNTENNWYHWQKDQLLKQYQSPDFKLVTEVQLFSNPHEPYTKEYVGSGFLTITQNEIFYQGTYLDQTQRIDFSYDHLTQLPFATNSHFEIPDEKALYRFEPLNKKTIIHWVQLVDIINQLRSKDK